MSSHRIAVAVAIAVIATTSLQSVGVALAAVGATSPATHDVHDGIETDAPTATPQTPSGTGRVVAVYPNPVTGGDEGEFVLLSLPTGNSTGNLTLTDGSSTIPVGSNATDTDTVARLILVTNDADAGRRHYRNATLPGIDANGSVRVVEAPGLGLANGGDSVSLTKPSGQVVSRVSYGSAPEGDVYRNGSFQPLGATDHPVWTSEDVNATAFVLPDTVVPIESIRSADERVYLAGYTFASNRTARALERASTRGVDVRVLVDDAPVGGVTRRQVAILDRLAASNVTVRALGGDRGRYDFHHAKYLVADDTAVVLTENWKPSGTGGHANRGWGVVLDDHRVAADLARVFTSDWRALDARPWHAVVDDVTIEPAQQATETYQSRTAPRTVTVDAVTVATGPDNAERVIRGALRNATDRVHVLQMTADRDGVLLQAAIDAARRGVDVQILLSSAWYARDENRRVVDALNALAEREDLPLHARLVEPAGRFRKVHAKGVVVDDTVVLGSVNWNDHSLRKNREIAVVLAGDDVADYYATAFHGDWTATSDRSMPLWLAVAGALATIVVLGLLARKITFE